jgi:hypothetical protein
MRVLSLVVVLLLAACRPVGLEGQPCEEGPCAVGLICVEGVCETPPVPECVDDEGCFVAGLFNGRVCVDETCVDAGCDADDDCGTRICDLGVCVDPEGCGVDADCGAGRVCEAGLCRDGCDDDGECGGFASCVEGRCFQQCFIDLLCFGDICEGGLCVPAECGADVDCGEGNVFCDGGRCATFTPCDEDDDCFDPNFRCSDLGRCEERPLCTTDPQCGQGALCIAGHCRPVDTCAVDDDCEQEGRECVAGRCVQAPTCRADQDCGADQRCVNLLCEDIVAGDAASLIADTPFGPCEADGNGACSLALYLGETLSLAVGVFDAEGLPIDASVAAAASIGGATVDDDVVSFTASAAGEATLTLTSGGVTHDAIRVAVIDDEAQALRVLVQHADGTPAAGALVRAATDEATTDVDGVARFAVGPAAVGEATVRASLNGRGALWFGADLTGDLRVVLPAPTPDAPADAAGITATVLSTGDELGPVGAGLVLPRAPSRADVGLAALFGDAFAGALTLPLIGDLPILLPAGVTLSAALPVVGDVTVKERAFVAGAGGPAAVTAFEGRFEQNDLFGVFGGGDDVAVALNLAAAAEGMDLEVRFTGALDALPLVEDGDLADGVADIDGDGDVTELVPDYLSFPELEIRPDRSPDERVGLETGPLPAGARARALVVVGHEVPGLGAVPTGLGVITGGVAQIKARAPATAALSRAPRFIRAEAILDDSGRSTLTQSLAAFSADLDIGPFLEVPAGAFSLPDVPAPGQQLITLPSAVGATTYRVRITAGGLDLDVIAASRDGGRSLILDDPTLAGAILGPLEVLRLPGADADQATRAPFLRGGRAAPLDRDASAAASE